ncbi:uncharacterized protein LOC119073217 [Bradysia coprophila]|uniref:uncharacterized protein LOC119073217 n=1 Tax=Bradysia coprophila TaxID=38358 RepID=UPI00187D948F|nr:uncharacterized protein LOC119073217 [Bradysia coprophila]
MPPKLTLLLVIGLLTLTHNCYGQALESRFIVQLGHFTQPFLNQTVIRCAGTLISETHILCTASCVIVQSPAEIAVNIKVVTLVPEGGNTSSSTLVPATGVFIHPFYDHNQYANNAAIVTTNVLRLNPHLGFAPRSLGSLSTSTPCNLFGWGGELLDPRRDAVMVTGPVACDPNYPQSYCTVFDSVSHSTCDAMQGSPLTCGNDDITVAGFVTTDGGCSTDTGRTMLNYHSIRDFRDWIVGVFGPELPARDAVNFIVTVLERNETSIPRCFGTVIASNRVLTTATCATIDSSLHVELLVQTRIVQGSTSSSTNFATSQIYIHPYYSEENPLENNVAVIEIIGTFDQRIVPRTLGNLQQNSSCQLFGWGPTNIGFTRGDPINVNGPQFCDPNHPQAFCTSHPTVFHHSCNAMTGSPVTCDGNESVVTGFLINNATCNTNNGRASLRYHSVSEFTDWILHPTNQRNQRSTSVSTKMSALFVFVSILLSSLFN